MRLLVLVGVLKKFVVIRKTVGKMVWETVFLKGLGFLYNIWVN